MADQKEQRRPIIEYAVAKPFVDAAALGLGCGGPAAFTSAGFWAGFVAGSSFSFMWHWGNGNLSRPKATKVKSSRGRQREINVQGKPWAFDHVAPGQFVTRQSAIKDFLGFLGWRKQKSAQRNTTPAIPKPRWMTEQVFHSHCNGLPIQLLEKDIIRFLRMAQKLQKKWGKGKGLSERTWIRFAGERPLWYQELPRPAWYEAMKELLYAAQKYSGKQLIVEVGPRQIALAREAGEIMEALRWLEAECGYEVNDTSININTERGESNFGASAPLN